MTTEEFFDLLEIELNYEGLTIDEYGYDENDNYYWACIIDGDQYWNIVFRPEDELDDEYVLLIAQRVFKERNDSKKSIS